jgi:predicted transcriptional regulator
LIFLVDRYQSKRHSKPEREKSGFIVVIAAQPVLLSHHGEETQDKRPHSKEYSATSMEEAIIA